MSVEPRIQSSVRPRPLADAPIDALLARAEELARRWAIALILARPFEEIGEIPLEDLAREGPGLCQQLVRALGSEAELERMTGAGASTGREDAALAGRLGPLAGAREASAIVVSVEALRGAVWETLLEELRWPTTAFAGGASDRSSERQVADLGDRLAFVCATVAAAAIDGAVAAPDTAGTLRTAEEAIGPGGQGRAGPLAAILIDEREGIRESRREAERPAGRSLIGDTRGPDRPSPAQQIRARPLPWDTPPPAEMHVRRATGQRVMPSDEPA